MAKRKAFPLRINEALYDELRVWAESEFRSVNGQIEFLLRQAVQKRRGKRPTDQDADASTDPPAES